MYYFDDQSPSSMLLKYRDKTLKTFTPNLQEFFDILYYSNESHVGDVFQRFT